MNPYSLHQMRKWYVEMYLEITMGGKATKSLTRIKTD